MTKKDVASRVMQQINNQKITMRPGWYFTLVTFIASISVLLFSSLSVYLVAILTIKIRIENSDMPMFGARQRLSDLLSSFPWWILLLAIASIVALIWILKKYSKLYRYKMGWIITGVISVSLILGFILSYAPIGQTHSGGGSASQSNQQKGNQLRGVQR